jgi:hypothetical protein
MDNVTRGEVVVLSNDGFEVFEMVERKGFLIPPAPFAVAKKAPVKLAPLADEDEFANYIAVGGL